MKFRRNILVILYFITLLIYGSISVSATDTVFVTETMSDNEISHFLSYTDIRVLNFEPDKDSIECFDVNKNNMVALGFSDSEEKTICVYTSEGIFVYGYKFNCMGSFYLDWDENNIIVYSVRGDIAFVVSEDGDIEDIFEIKNTQENHYHWRNYSTSTKCTVGNNEYSLRNNMGIFNFFASSYSQLVLTYSDGSTRIIYDVNQNQILTYIVRILLVVLLYIFTILFVIKKRKGKQINQGTVL